MAKLPQKNANGGTDEDEIIISGEDQGNDEASKLANDVVVQDGVDAGAEVTVQSEKKVSVKLIKDHTCHIGGETYHFVGGEEVKVPMDVKRILAEGGLLTVL